MDIIQALINNGQADGIREASSILEQMKERVQDEGEDPEEVLHEYGLEPDYIFELIVEF